MTMNLRQLKTSASTIASHLRAGVSMQETMQVLSVVQGDYFEHWDRARERVAAGSPLFECLTDIWPETLLSAVRAGEEAGKLDAVLTHLTSALDVEQQISDTMKLLRYPILITIVGIVVFLGLMVFAVPATARVLHVEHSNFITGLAMSLESFFKSYWMPISLFLVAGGYKLFGWIRSDDGKDTIEDWSLQIPIMQVSIKNMRFGVWADYMALVIDAGIPTTRALLVTAPILPARLRVGLELAERDLTTKNTSLEDTVNLKLLDDDDPRRDWPLFIRNAIVLGDRAGGLDTQLQRVGSELVKIGIESFVVQCKAAEALGTLFAASLVGLSFLAIYGPIIGLIKTH
jgi:type II secretory pathway component PulF